MIVISFLATTISFIVSWNNKINDIQELEHSPQYVYKEKKISCNSHDLYCRRDFSSLFISFCMAATTALLVDGTKTDVFSYKRSLPINYVIRKSYSCIYMLQKLKKRKACKDCMSSSWEREKYFFLHLCHTLVVLSFISLAVHIPLCDPLTIVRSEHQQKGKRELWKINDAWLD